MNKMKPTVYMVSKRYIRTLNGSVYGPFLSTESLKLHFTEQFGASESQWARVITEVEQSGECVIRLR